MYYLEDERSEQRNCVKTLIFYSNFFAKRIHLPLKILLGKSIGEARAPCAPGAYAHVIDQRWYSKKLYIFDL